MKPTIKIQFLENESGRSHKLTSISFFRFWAVKSIRCEADLFFFFFFWPVRDFEKVNSRSCHELFILAILMDSVSIHSMRSVRPEEPHTKTRRATFFFFFLLQQW